MQNGINYRFLDFPSLPAELEQECLDQLSRKEFFLFDLGQETWEGQMIFNGASVYKKQCVFEVYDAPKIVKEWLFDNTIVTDKNIRINVQRSYGGNALLPHRDKPEEYRNDLIGQNDSGGRNIAWNYLLSESGPVTCFYETLNINSIIEKVLIPKSAWHELKVNKIHGVENIIFDRVSLSISLD